METVYIVGIVVAGVVVVAVVWLLRARLKSARMRASLREREFSGEVDAFSPKATPPPATAARPPSVDVSGNVVIGGGIVRVWRSGVRVARNWLLGKPKIDIKETPPEKGRRR